MASSSDIRAGRAYVELYVNRSRFMRGLSDARQQFQKWGESLTAIGTKMAATATLAAAPFAFATRTFMGFEDQMKAVQGVTGATGDAFDMLYKKAKELGRTTSFTAGQVGSGMLSLGRAGFNPKEIDESIQGMLDLARATGTDLAVASDIAANSLRAFNIQASEMGMVADVLVATANNSAQTLEDLGESMSYVAPIAQEYGLTIQQTAKMLGVLANMG